MKSAVCCLLIMTLATLVSDVSCNCDTISILNCYTTFSTDVLKDTSSISNACRAYTTYVDCLKNICDSYATRSEWEDAKNLLQKNGINCNSGRNLQFSLISGLMGILIAILCK